jgi:hypothetical protein
MFIETFVLAYQMAFEGLLNFGKGYKRGIG